MDADSATFPKMIFTTGFSVQLPPPSPIVLLLSVMVEAYQLCLLIFSHFIMFSACLGSLAFLYLLYPSKMKRKRKFPLMFLFIYFFQNGCIPPRMCSSSFYCLVTSSALMYQHAKFYTYNTQLSSLLLVSRHYSFT